MRSLVWVATVCWIGRATSSFLVDTVLLPGEEAKNKVTALGEQKEESSRTKVVKKSNPEQSNNGAYYFVAQHTEQRKKPVLKHRNDIPERTKKKKVVTTSRTIDVEDNSKSTKESEATADKRAKGDKKVYKEYKKGKEKGKGSCKESKKGKGGKKGKRSDKSTSGKGKPSDDACHETDAIGSTTPPSAGKGKGSAKKSSDDVTTSPAPTTVITLLPTSCGKGKSKNDCVESLGPTLVSSIEPTPCGKGKGSKGSKGGKGGKGKSPKECPPDASPAPSLSTILPSDLPSFNGGGSAQPSGTVPRPTPQTPTAKVPTKVAAPKVPTKAMSPTRSPRGVVPSPMVAPPVKVPMAAVPSPIVAPPVKVPMAAVPSPMVAPPNAIDTPDTTPIGPDATIVPTSTSAPTPSVRSVFPSTTTPSLGVPGTTTAPSIAINMPPVAGSDVSATPFTVTYSGGSGATAMDMDEAAAVTLDYLEAYFTSQFGLSAETMLVDFVGELTSSDPAAGTASFDVTAVFAELSDFLPATEDIDALMQAAFSSPFVEGLLTSLSNLPDTNPLQGTTGIMYNTSRRRHRYRFLSFSSRNT